MVGALQHWNLPLAAAAPSIVISSRWFGFGFFLLVPGLREIPVAPCHFPEGRKPNLATSNGTMATGYPLSFLTKTMQQQDILRHCQDGSCYCVVY